MRADRVTARAVDASVDALLVTNLTNIRWITGFSGSNATLMLRPDGICLVTDGRYGDQAAAELAAAGVSADIRVGYSQAEQNRLLHAEMRSGERVGFEADHVPVSRHAGLVSSLPVELVATTGLVEAERRTKDDGEVALMAEACRIAGAALAEVVPMLNARPTEADVRDELDYRMRRLGAQGPSYDTIVATGPTGASRPHHRPDTTVIEEGHTVVIDVGALVGGYHSDMTRTFVVGEPSALQHEVYAVVAAAQQAGIDAVRPGVELATIDAACRDVIIDHGFGPWFSHGTGHGVGLLIHEDPFVNATATGTLQRGDVVTVEPGVYRVDLGGVRIEDLLVVTDDGCRILTTTPKDSPCPPSPPTT